MLLGSTTCKHCGHTSSQHDDFALLEVRSAGKALSTLISKVDDLLTPDSGLPKALLYNELDSIICRREATVAELWYQLQLCRILHAGGTPACAKTTLGILLQDFIQRTQTRDNHLQNYVAFENSRQIFSHPILWLAQRYLKATLEFVGLRLKTLFWSLMSVLHLSFALEWSDQEFVRPLRLRPLSVASFFLRLSHLTCCTTATQLFPSYTSPECRISTSPLSDTIQSVGLYYTFTEFDDAVRRYNDGFETTGQPLTISEGSKYLIWCCTNGHPSAVHCLLEFMAHSKVSQFCIQWIDSSSLT